MRWLPPFLAALLLALPATADMYQDGSNASPTFWARAAPHVAGNAALQATATATYPAGVWRDDYRRAPPLFFMPQTGTCAAAGMVNDIGGCVDATGGNSWTAIHPADGLDIRQFGAPVDGTSSSTAAIQAAITEALRIGNASANDGAPPVVLPKGDWVVDAQINCHPTADLRLVWKQGARVLVNMTGAGNSAFDCTGPGTPPTRSGQALYLVDSRFGVDSRIASGTTAAKFLRYRNASNLTLQGTGEWVHNRGNSAMSVSSCWNCRLGQTAIWGAGHQWMWKDVSTATFSIPLGGTTITASAGVFDASDVGKVILLTFKPGSTAQLFTITGYVGPTQVTTALDATEAYVAMEGQFGAVTGSMTVGSNTLNLDKPVATAADIGRIVYVFGAGTAFVAYSARATLRARVGTVPAANQVTLVDEDGAAANAGFTVTGATVVTSPAVEIWDDHPSVTSDVMTNNFQIANPAGAGLVLKGGNGYLLSNLKINATNTFYDNRGTTFHAIFDETDNVSVSGFWMPGASVNQYGNIYIGGTTAQIKLGGISSYIAQDKKLVWKDISGIGSSVIVGPIALTANNLIQRTVDNLIGGTGNGNIELQGGVSAYRLTYYRPPLATYLKPPTSCAGLVAGTLYNNAGAAAICP